jgi:pimeloyl-ACP methyl ester carboxylesterase
MGITRFAQNELARLSYEVSGPEHVAPVVLLHATLLEKRSLEPLRDKLAERFFVVQPDARGHGGSSGLAGRSFTVSDMATDLYAVLEAAGVAAQPAILVGHGQGAITALEFARIRPDLVMKLVLIEPDALSLLDGEVDADIAQARESTRTAHRAAADAVYKELTDRALDIYLGQRWGAGWRDILPKPRLAAIKRHAPGLTASLDALDRYQILPSELKAMEIPALVIAAETTPPAEQRIALKLREQLPNSEMVIAADLPAASPFTTATLVDFIAGWIG